MAARKSREPRLIGSKQWHRGRHRAPDFEKDGPIEVGILYDKVDGRGRRYLSGVMYPESPIALVKNQEDTGWKLMLYGNGTSEREVLRKHDAGHFLPQEPGHRTTRRKP